jgi:psiF repeat
MGMNGANMSWASPGEKIMHRYVFLAAMLLAMLPSAPSFAVSEKDKMATCKFGADDQKLQGAPRAAFMKKCMANRDDPRGPATVPAGAGGVPPPPKQ